MTDRIRWPASRRGQANIIGFLLVFALVLSAVSLVSVTGLNTLADVREAERANNGVRAMGVLSDNLADVSRRGAPSRATEVALERSALSIGEQITITVSGSDAATGDTFTVEHRTAPLIYRVTDTTTLVHEAGAVFRLDRTGALVQRDPPVVIGSQRTGLTVLNYTGETGRTVAGSTVLVRAVHRNTTVPIANTTGTWDSLTLEVESPRYEQWATALRDDPDVSGCTTTPATDTVTCTLPAPPQRLYVTVVRIELSLEV